MRFKINTDNLEKEVMRIIKTQTMEFKCPKCELYIGDYSLDDLKTNPKVYCNNCDTIINYNLKPNE